MINIILLIIIFVIRMICNSFHLLFINKDIIMDFFKNPSGAAFVGAFAAFLLVILTDWIRRLIKGRSIPKMIRMNIDLSKRKIEAVINCQEHVKKNKFLPTPIMKYPVKDIKNIEMQVLNQLKQDEKFALDSICYHCEEIDKILDGAVNKIEEHQRIMVQQGEENSMINELRKQIKIAYNESVINIQGVIDMSELFIQKKYKQIINMKEKN